MIKKILFCAYDAGGGNAIFPVVQKLLKDTGFEILCLIGGPSKEIFNKEGLDFTDVDSFGDDEMLMQVKNFKPDIEVGGRSAGLTFDKKILKELKRLGTRTICVLDFWANYRQSFSESDGDFVYMPDTICVMDNITRDEMVSDGFNSDRIAVTGNPYFDVSFSRIKSGAEDKNKILFVSQPYDDEFEVLNDVLQAVKSESENYGFIIRPHPKENIEKFERYKSDKVSVDNVSRIEDLISSAGLVIGINSMALFQASVAGKLVLSYQPNLKTADLLISNRFGLSRLVKNESDLRVLIKQYFGGSLLLPKGSAGGIIVKDATKNVINLLKNI